MITLMFKTGDPVLHPFHGAGTISVVSPDGKYATIKFPSAKDSRGYYVTTSAILRLTPLPK